METIPIILSLIGFMLTLVGLFMRLLDQGDQLNDFKMQAVRNGAAYYTKDSDGDLIFQWKNPK